MIRYRVLFFIVVWLSARLCALYDGEGKCGRGRERTAEEREKEEKGRVSECKGWMGSITGKTGSDDEDVWFATRFVKDCRVGSVYLECHPVVIVAVRGCG